MNRLQHLVLKALRRFVDDHQGLMSSRRHHGRHQPATHRQLVQPRLRNVVATRGRNDGGIGRAFGKALHAVAKQQVDIVQAKGALIFAGLFMQAL